MLSDQALMPLAMTGFGALAAVTDLVDGVRLVGAGFAALVLWSAFRPGLDSTPPALPTRHDESADRAAAEPAGQLQSAEPKSAGPKSAEGRLVGQPQFAEPGAESRPRA